MKGGIVMSIASRVNTLVESRDFPDKLLLEPESGELRVKHIVAAQGGSAESAKNLAELLRLIRQGVQSDEKVKTIETINLLIELAYLWTGDYERGLEDFRSELEGRKVNAAAG
jgi:hypothetical protein